MNKLLALLPSTPAEGDEYLQAWVVHPEGDVQSVTMTLQAASEEKFSEFVVIVPASMLAWHHLQLPAGIKLRRDARLQPVLQNLVEETVLGDAAALHIALPPNVASGVDIPVAVCQKAWLGSWLSTFEKTGLKVGRVLPQIPPEILEETGIVSGRMHEAWATALVDGVPLTLPATLESIALLGSQKWAAYAGVFDDASLCIPSDQLALLTDEQWVEQLLESQWDLAQHEFASNTKDRWRRKFKNSLQAVLHAPQWRSSRVAATCLAAVMVVGLNAKAWWSASALKDKKQATVKVLQQSFPHVQVVVDAPAQMQREVQILSQASGVLQSTDLQPLLAAAGIALSGVAQRPTSWEYTGNTLLLRGLRAEAVDAMNRQLQGTTYRVVVAGDTLSLQVAQ